MRCVFVPRVLHVAAESIPTAHCTLYALHTAHCGKCARVMKGGGEGRRGAGVCRRLPLPAGRRVYVCCSCSRRQKQMRMGTKTKIIIRFSGAWGPRLQRLRRGVGNARRGACDGHAAAKRQASGCVCSAYAMTVIPRSTHVSGGDTRIASARRSSGACLTFLHHSPALVPAAAAHLRGDLNHETQ